MAAYVLPIIAFAVLLVMILRDAERYKREHPPVPPGSWPGSGDKARGQ